MACMAPTRDLMKQCDGRCPCKEDDEWYKWKEAHRKAQEDAKKHKEEGWKQHKKDFPHVHEEPDVKTHDDAEL